MSNPKPESEEGLCSFAAGELRYGLVYRYTVSAFGAETNIHPVAVFWMAWPKLGALLLITFYKYNVRFGDSK